MLDKAEAAEAKLAAKGNRIAKISVDVIKSILLRRGVDQQLVPLGQWAKPKAIKLY